MFYDHYAYAHNISCTSSYFVYLAYLGKEGWLRSLDNYFVEWLEYCKSIILV